MQVNEPIETEVLGGIPVSHRVVPWWLLVFSVAVAAVAVWYVLSFSSTPYQGTFAGTPGAPAASP